MVVPEKMEHAMNDQVAQMVAQEFSFLRRFAGGRLERYDDVAETERPAVGAGCREDIDFDIGERQDIGRLVAPAEGLVQSANTRIVRQEQTGFGRSTMEQAMPACGGE